MTELYMPGTFHAPPGIILGPQESLLAVLVWLNECLSIVNKQRSSWRAGIVKRVPCVHYSKRDTLIAAHLLFGKFDALAGMFLLDYCLASHGVTASRREIFGDIVPFGHGPKSPFAHDLEVGRISHPFTTEVKPEPSQRHWLGASIAGTLQRSGFVVSSETRQSIRAAIEDRAALPPGYFSGDLGPIGLSLTATLRMLERAVQADLPLLSADCGAPAWRNDDSVEVSARILKVVWDDITWLPRPRTLGEASRMREDERITGLRNAIDLWRHKIAVGDFGGWSDLRADVRRQVQYFSRKSWASRVARLITYLAVPIGVAETLLGASVVGITIGTAGAASQCVSDLIERHKSRHWLSLGRDFVTHSAPPNNLFQRIARSRAR